jgi:hypothetical protein
MIVMPELKVKLLSMVRPGPGGCIDWTAGCRSNYGSVWWNGKTYSPHRLFYLAFRGSIPDKMVVRHTCDRPLCCAPHHLVTGPQRENLRDAIDRGRIARGERVAGAKLTEKNVFEIRHRLAAGEMQKAIAAAFGVSPAAIGHIALGRSWKHLGPAPIPRRPRSQTLDAIRWRLRRHLRKLAAAKLAAENADEQFPWWTDIPPDDYFGPTRFN